MLSQDFQNHVYYLVIVSGMIHTGDQSPQDRLGDVQTCKTTLASAYVLCCLSAV